MTMQRAFIGTGLIGAGLAEAALGRGEKVRVWNRTHAKTAPLVEKGALAFESIAEACQGVDFIHIALTSDGAVDSVLPAILAERGDAILVDHSTTSVDGTRTRQHQLNNQGIPFLDAPVFMSPAACRAASGVIVVAGPKSAWEKAQAAIEPMTGSVLFLGEEPGQAAALKLIGNGIILSVVGGLADGFALGRAQGVEGSEILSLFDHFKLDWILGGRGAQMAAGNFDTSWSLKMARKDLGLMLDAAGENPLAVLPGLAARADDMIETGVGEQDVGVLAAPPK